MAARVSVLAPSASSHLVKFYEAKEVQRWGLPRSFRPTHLFSGTVLREMTRRCGEMDIYALVSWSRKYVRSDSYALAITFLCLPAPQPHATILSSLLWHHKVANPGARPSGSAHQDWVKDSTLVLHREAFISFQGTFEPDALPLANESRVRVMEKRPSLLHLSNALCDKQHRHF